MFSTYPIHSRSNASQGIDTVNGYQMGDVDVSLVITESFVVLLKKREGQFTLFLIFIPGKVETHRMNSRSTRMELRISAILVYGT